MFLARTKLKHVGTFLYWLWNYINTYTYTQKVLLIINTFDRVHLKVSDLFINQIIYRQCARFSHADIEFIWILEY